MIQRSLTLVLILLVTTACATTPREVKIITKPVEIEIFQPDLPDAIKLERPKWYVVNRKNLEGFLEELEKIQGDSPVFFAFTPQDYEKMSYNLQEVRRYILQQKEVIIYYQRVTQPQSWEEKNDSARSQSLKPSEEVITEEQGRNKFNFKRLNPFRSE
jgi:hypothetical protein